MIESLRYLENYQKMYSGDTSEKTLKNLPASVNEKAMLLPKTMLCHVGAILR